MIPSGLLRRRRQDDGGKCQLWAIPGRQLYRRPSGTGWEIMGPDFEGISTPNGALGVSDMCIFGKKQRRNVGLGGGRADVPTSPAPRAGHARSLCLASSGGLPRRTPRRTEQRLRRRCRHAAGQIYGRPPLQTPEPDRWSRARCGPTDFGDPMTPGDLIASGDPRP